MNKLVSILSLLYCSLSFGQYANDWIDYSQKYYSFKIWEDGVYQIDYNTIAIAGLPVSSINPDNFQLFAFESEQQILVEDGNDGSFDPGDFILFYGRKNTIWMDTLMYDTPEHVANEFYPHYSDTINYFLTWNNSTSNARVIEETDINFPSYTPVPYLIKSNHVENHNSYQLGLRISGMSYSTYTEGEGWSGVSVNSSAGTNYIDVNIPTSNCYGGPGAPAVQVNAVSMGASDAAIVSNGNHHLRLQYGAANTTVIDTIFTGYQLNKLSFNLPLASVGASTTKIRHQLVNDLGVASDYQSVTSVEIVYPHSTNMGGVSYFKGDVEHNTAEPKSRFDLMNFSSANPMGMVVSGQNRLIPVVNNAGTYQAIIPNDGTGLNQEVVFFDQSDIQNIVTLSAINGTGDFQDFSAMSFEDAYIIVSGGNLMGAANDYSLYRQSPAGGGYTVALLDEQELTMQFGGGVNKHPFGIRNFVKYAYENTAVKPNHLFLIGKGIREANESVAAQGGTRQNATSYNECIVPAMGFPTSDNVLTANLSGNNLSPLIPTGRLAAKSPAEVTIYLNKMIEYEANQDPEFNL